MRTIDQFMWPYQPHFRISVQVTMDHALETIGADLRPRVFLVGYADDPAARHSVCIEPETGSLQPAHLANVLTRAEELYQADPEGQIRHSDRGDHEARQASLRRQARARAIVEAVEASGLVPGRRLIVSSGGHNNGFWIHCCVELDAEAFDRLPSLRGEEVNRWPAPSSFPRFLIEMVLHEADLAMQAPDAGIGAIRRSTRDLVNEAAERFCDGCLYRTHNFDMSHPFERLNEITARVYEGAAANGRMLLAPPTHEAIDVVTVLTNIISLKSARAVRKLLEITDDDLRLLVHNEGAYGLGRLTTDVMPPDVFEIAVTGHATWELRNGSVPLLRVAYREASLPRPVISLGLLRDTLGRVLPTGAAVDVLVSLVSAATAARHGTTLVISAGAETEARRLSGQATLIAPQPLTPELISHYSRVDGAVLVDHEGTCHAFGVILDGQADGHGDPARGSRYNSSLRYQRSAEAPTVVVVVSEDGDVSQLPSLMPRIHRQDILDAITRLYAAVEGDTGGEFSDAYDALRDLRFYLTAEQCTTLNEFMDTLEERQLQEGKMTIRRPVLQPDPDFDDSYFLN